MQAPTSPICAVVELAIQPQYAGFDGTPVRPLQQVVLRPDKIREGYIRLGETPGDEALCWIALENVEIVFEIGPAIRSIDANGQEKWTVQNKLEKAA
jgi:hypothetical protein